MRRTLASLLAVCAFCVSATAQTSPLPLALQQAISATVTAKTPYAFDLELITEQRNWRAHFEPDERPRLRLTAPAREALSAEDQRAFDRIAEQLEGLSWCAGETMSRVANVRLVRENDLEAVYAFQPTRASIRGPARRFAPHLRGEFTLIKSGPDISRLRIHMPQPFSPAPLIDVSRIEIGIVCALAPNGRFYAAETTSDVRGSAFGQAFDDRRTQRARNLTAPS